MLDKILEIMGVSQNYGGKYKSFRDGVNHQYDTVGAGYLEGEASAAAVQAKMRQFFHDAALRVDGLPGVMAHSGAQRQASALTSIALMPDGQILHGTLGDSPLMAFVVGKDNRVIDVRLLNDPDNRDPWNTNVIYSDVTTAHFNNKIAESAPNSTMHQQDLKALLGENGEKLVIVNASDGLLEGALPARIALFKKESPSGPGGLPPEKRQEVMQKGFAQVETNTHSALTDLGQHVEQVLQSGGNSQAVADRLANAQLRTYTHDNNGNPYEYEPIPPGGRDNTSCAVMVIDPKNLPDKPVISMIADGVSSHSSGASYAVLDSFKETPDIKVTHAMRENRADKGFQGVGHDKPQDILAPSKVEPTPAHTQAPQPNESGIKSQVTGHDKTQDILAPGKVEPTPSYTQAPQPNESVAPSVTPNVQAAQEKVKGQIGDFKGISLGKISLTGTETALAAAGIAGAVLLVGGAVACVKKRRENQRENQSQPPGNGPQNFQR